MKRAILLPLLAAACIVSAATAFASSHSEAPGTAKDRPAADTHTKQTKEEPC